MGSIESAERALQTPRAAGVTGILCAVVLGAAILLIRNAVPNDPAGDPTAWVLNLVPFAGIFFLQYMATVRSYIGAAEDKFFSTLFLGSGVLFVAALFVSASVASSLQTDVSHATSESWQSGRDLTLAMLVSYSMRMASVFTLITTTIGQKVGIFPRWLAGLGYLVGLYLMFVASGVPWSEFVFPVWILVVGVYVLVTTLRPQQAQASPSTRGDSAPGDDVRP